MGCYTLVAMTIRMQMFDGVTDYFVSEYYPIDDAVHYLNCLKTKDSNGNSVSDFEHIINYNPSSQL